MARISDKDLEKAMELYSKRELSFEALQALCDEAEREEKVDDLLEQTRRQRKGGSGWQPFVGIGVTFRK